MHCRHFDFIIFFIDYFFCLLLVFDIRVRQTVIVQWFFELIDWLIMMNGNDCRRCYEFWLCTFCVTIVSQPVIVEERYNFINIYSLETYSLFNNINNNNNLVQNISTTYYFFFIVIRYTLCLRMVSVWYLYTLLSCTHNSTHHDSIDSYCR